MYVKADLALQAPKANSMVVEKKDYGLTLCYIIPTFNDFKEESFGKHCGKGESRRHTKCDFVLGRVENILGKGENAAYQHFFSCSHDILKGFFLRVVKVGIVL